MKTEICGDELEYDAWGEGPDLVFLHGWGAPYGIYAGVLSLLSQRFRVTALNMPGVGGSPDPENPLTVDDYIKIADGFINSLGIKNCTVVCHSHGGRVAAGLMGEKRDFEVERAVFIAAAGVPPRRSALYKAKARLYSLLRFLGTNALTAPLFKEAYEVRRERRSSEDYKNATPVMRKTLSNVVNADMRPFMMNIGCPVLLIWGENDTATPLWAGQEMERLIKGSGLAVIKGAGHFPFADNPQQFYAVLKAFLFTEEM